MAGQQRLGGGAFNVLGGFSNSTALNPHGSVVLDSAGDVFGVAQNGGPGQYGSLWMYSPSNSFAGIQVLQTFNNTNGATPYGDLIFDASGQDLWGTTTNGGTNFDGTVFKFSLATHQLTTVVNFSDSTGIRPEGGLVQDKAGNMYGTTWLSGPGGFGTVFKIPAGTSTLQTLATFDNGVLANGANPQAALTIDAAGNLFGTVAAGGANSDGMIFEILAGTQTPIIRASFNGANGESPSGPMIVDAAGDLFGVTTDGGSNNTGEVFELPAGSNTINGLVSLSGVAAIGVYPSLTADMNGNLWGTSQQALFEITGSGYVVPEPSGVAIIGAALLIVGRRVPRRRKTTHSSVGSASRAVLHQPLLNGPQVVHRADPTKLSVAARDNGGDTHF